MIVQPIVEPMDRFAALDHSDLSGRNVSRWQRAQTAASRWEDRNQVRNHPGPGPGHSAAVTATGMETQSSEGDGLFRQETRPLAADI